MTAFLMIFRRFPTTFRRFSKIVPKARRTFSNIFREFLKIPEDVRRLPKTFEVDPKMFRWYTNEFKYILRDERDITETINIFTCEDIISSHVRISYRFHQFVTTPYTTDFYIIKWFFYACKLLKVGFEYVFDECLNHPFYMNDPLLIIKGLCVGYCFLGQLTSTHPVQHFIYVAWFFYMY